MAYNKNDPYDFSPYPSIEKTYHKALKAIARESARIIKQSGDVTKAAELLYKYSEIISGYADKLARRTVTLVLKKNYTAWAKLSEKIAAKLRDDATVPFLVNKLVAQNAELIKAIPLDVAARATRMAGEAAVEGMRAEELAEDLQNTLKFSYNKAALIARTEISRIGTAITQHRAQTIGSEGYIWRTAHDSDVRESHRKMDGKFVRWDDPPTLDGMTGHAGEFSNCRCIPEPVIPTEYLPERHAYTKKY